MENDRFLLSLQAEVLHSQLVDACFWQNKITLVLNINDNKNVMRFFGIFFPVDGVADKTEEETKEQSGT